MTISSLNLELTPFDNDRLFSLCGRFDEHIHLIEKSLNVEISNRGNIFKISGNKKDIQLTKQVLRKLYEQTKNNFSLTPHHVHLALREHELESKDLSLPSSIKTPNTLITLRNKSQKQYINNIHNLEINFGIGPAGTGKTYLAVASAISALEQHKVRRIVLVRPIVETGEKLGFLPGDFAEKVDPYLRPLHDALYEMLGFDRVSRLIDQQIIEIAPLAYMRGRTFSDAFIILDESQNTTIEQMQMFLTRIGFGSYVVITGDITQIDLPRGKLSGLRHAIDVLKGIEEIGFNYFSSKDVVRHGLVQKIIDAYSRSDAEKSR